MPFDPEFGDVFFVAIAEEEIQLKMVPASSSREVAHSISWEVSVPDLLADAAVPILRVLLMACQRVAPVAELDSH